MWFSIQVNCLPFKQVQSAVKIDIFNHKIRLHPTMILNIKESFKGQYTFQKPAWRDECQFLPFRSMYKKTHPLAGGLLLCKSHFTDLFQHGKSSLLWGDIQASHSALAWQKHKTHPQRGWEKGIVCWCCPWWVSRAVGGSGRAQHPLLPGAGVLPAWEASVDVSTGISSFPCSSMWLHLQVEFGIWKWDIPAIIETSEVCTYSSGHYILFFFFFSLFLPFFPPCFNKILGTKTPRAGSDWAYNWQSSSQLNTPDVLPVPKGSHCVRGFLLNRTKQNSKALGLLGCWRETMGKQNSGQRDIYFSEGHGCPYTIPFKALWSFSNTIQSCSQAEIQRVQNLFIPSLM